jgi:hypothetical protein
MQDRGQEHRRQAARSRDARGERERRTVGWTSVDRGSGARMGEEGKQGKSEKARSNGKRKEAMSREGGSRY